MIDRPPRWNRDTSYKWLFSRVEHQLTVKASLSSAHAPVNTHSPEVTTRCSIKSKEMVVSRAECVNALSWHTDGLGGVMLGQS